MLDLLVGFCVALRRQHLGEVPLDLIKDRATQLTR